MRSFARFVNWKLVKRLDNWKLWMVVAYVGLGAFGLVLWHDYTRVSHDQAETARVVAERHADIIANADAQYQQCVKSRPTLTKIDLFLHGVHDLAHILVENSVSSHVAGPPGTKLYKAQVKNIRRLRAAAKDAANVYFPVPSMKQCIDLRAKLINKEESHGSSTS